MIILHQIKTAITRLVTIHKELMRNKELVAHKALANNKKLGGGMTIIGYVRKIL